MAPRVGVVGTTSWGTTLAILLTRNGHQVTLWARTPQEAAELASRRENRRLLPGIPLPDELRITSAPSEALGGADLVLLAVPSGRLRENLRRLRESIPPGCVLLSAVKGLERETGKRMSQAIEEEVPGLFQHRVAVLSGPNLSREVARGLPTSTVVACRDPAVARWVQEVVGCTAFRVYTSGDLVGVELAGALKNIIAIAAGVADGLGYGANAKAALITRGLVEITRLGAALGASPLTFAGLAGLGDLMATCFSPLSRNRFVGEQVGRGRPLKEVLASMVHTAEGVDTTVAARRLAREWGVEMPITEAAHQVLFEGLEPRQAVARLLGRAPGPEWPQDLLQPRT